MTTRYEELENLAQSLRTSEHEQALIESLLSENRAMRELLHEIRFVHGDALESGIREEVDALLNPESK